MVEKGNKLESRLKGPLADALQKSNDKSSRCLQGSDRESLL